MSTFPDTFPPRSRPGPLLSFLAALLDALRFADVDTPPRACRADLSWIKTAFPQLIDCISIIVRHQSSGGFFPLCIERDVFEVSHFGVLKSGSILKSKTDSLVRSVIHTKFSEKLR